MSKKIETLELKLKNQIETDPQFLKIKKTAHQVVVYLFKQPVTNITQMSESLDKAYNTITNILKLFIEISIASEKNAESKRNRLFHFSAYIK